MENKTEENTEENLEVPVYMDDLIKCFEVAIEKEYKFVAVKINIGDAVEGEVIINKVEFAEEKLEYYKKSYDEDLNHKFAYGVRITGFSFANNYEDIQNILGS